MENTHNKGHCQICNREIGTRTGTIAHHGYTRPGMGWQTESCMGAKHLPYELSCDRIAAAIESAEGYKSNLQYRKELLARDGHPTFTRMMNVWVKNGAYGSYQMRSVTFEWDAEQADKDAKQFGEGVTFYKANKDYEFNRKHAIAANDAEILEITKTIAALHDRITNWKKVW